MAMALGWILAIAASLAVPSLGAVQVEPQWSIQDALRLAVTRGEPEVLVPAGTYLTDDAPVYLSVHRSVHIRAVGGAAVIDCGGSSSGLDLQLYSFMEVRISGIHFRNCTSSVSDRAWAVGPLPDWCIWCWCSLHKCSKGGAVTVTTPARAEVVNASVTFTNCAFSGNKADKGGAVALGLFTNITNSLFAFEDCNFTENEALQLGGAAIDVMVDYSFVRSYYAQTHTSHTSVLRRSSILVSGCRFEGNLGASEGALNFWSDAGYLEATNIYVRDSLFIRNVGGNGPAVAMHVGGILTPQMNTLWLNSTRFERNNASGSSAGGAVLASFPMARLDPDPPMPLFFRTYARRIQIVSADCVFESNSAFIGGAYAIGNGIHSFHNVSFINNRARETGGAICLGCIGGGDAQFDCEDTLFSGNSASQAGGTLGSESSGSVSMKNCTFDMSGSDKGVTDFAINNAGPFRASDDSVWRCNANQRLLKGDKTVSTGTSGTLNADWNSDAIDVRLNRMQLTCLACPLNRFSPSRAELVGPITLYINSTTNPQAIVQEIGHVNQSTPYQCQECPFDMYMNDGRCHFCPPGRTLHASGAMSSDACGLDPVYLLLQVIVFIVIVIVMRLLAIGLPMPVKDISLDNGQVVVATCKNHRLLEHPLLRHRIWLSGTGHCLLDGSGLVHSAKVLDSKRLLLLHKSGEPVTDRIDASMGTLWVSPSRAPVCLGIWNVPVAVMVWTLSCAELSIIYTRRMWNAATLVVVIVSLLLGALDIINRRVRLVSPVARRRQEMRRKLLFGNPSPRASARGPERALSVGRLLAFYEHFQEFIRDRDMYYACANLIRPLTEPDKLSYAELAGPSHVTFFVSHYWGAPLRHFVESIEKHARQAGISMRAEDGWQRIPYWICSFSNNQWNLKDELSDNCEESSFYLALRSRSCRGCVMVLDEEAMPLTRSWCLFELLQTFLMRGEDECQNFKGLSLCTTGGVLNNGGTRIDIAISIARKLSSLDLEDATASNEQDKLMINNRVRSMCGGFPAMNRFVRTNVRDALLKVKDSFEGDFRGIVSALDEGRDLQEVERSLSAVPPASVASMEMEMPTLPLVEDDELRTRSPCSFTEP